MHSARSGVSELEWREDLRRAAIVASGRSSPGWLLGGLAVIATVSFVAILTGLGNSIGLQPRGFDEVQRFLEQSRRAATGAIPAEGLHPLVQQLWLLLVARFSDDVSVAARVLSGFSAILALFLAYQLCHSLADPRQADEQACFALLALTLSPAFFIAAAAGTVEVTHLTLVLGTLLCIQRAAASESSLTMMAFAGLLGGLSALVRPVSVLLLPAVCLWIWLARPFDDDPDNHAGGLRQSFGFVAAFVTAASVQVLWNLSQGRMATPWAFGELAALVARGLANPPGLLAALADGVYQYVAAEDLERLAAVDGAWHFGDWGAVLGGMIALAPSILKGLGLLGGVLLCWLGRLDLAIARARLLASVLLLFVLGSALGLVEERGTLTVAVLFLILAFAGLPQLVPGMLAGVAGLALVGLMLFHQLGAGYPVIFSPTYRVSERITEAVRASGGRTGQVLSTSWTLYDTHSPLRERYRHLPIYVDSVESLLQEMKRQHARYLVFDRSSGATHWPRLAALIEQEHPPAGLRPLTSPLKTAESPPNSVSIYMLE